MCTTSVFLPIRKKDEILANAYKEIKTEIEEILTKTNEKITMYESSTYAQTSVKLFHEIFHVDDIWRLLEMDICQLFLFCGFENEELK